MTEEIKEILYLENYISKYKGDEKSIINGNRLTTPAMLDYLEVKSILNYITNLQKENENLKNKINNLTNIGQTIFTGKSYNDLALENEKLKETLQTDKLMKAFMVEHNRNEKAVEYIKSHNPSDIGICGNNKKYYYILNEDSVDNLLNILQGGDE